MLKIITYPNKILRQKSKIVENINDKEIKLLTREMIKTMLKSDGIGLAAPQIGKNLRIIVINTEDGPIALINPKITKKSLFKELGEEGCLSLPGVFGLVKRHKKIRVKTCLPDGREICFDAPGLFARVIQHEIDHLDGILFIDKTQKITKGEIKIWDKIKK